MILKTKTRISTVARHFEPIWRLEVTTAPTVAIGRAFHETELRYLSPCYGEERLPQRRENQLTHASAVETKTRHVADGMMPASSFNPRVPCGTRHHLQHDAARDAKVSIHASRVGRDLSATLAKPISSCFNPRVPCGTRLAARCWCRSQARSFNPRVPCGTRLIFTVT